MTTASLTPPRTIATVVRSLPATIDEATRQVDLTIATEASIDGIILSCAPGAVLHGPAPVPVLLDHERSTRAMAGRILSIRSEGQQLIGRVQFSDAPAADAGWELARSGVGVSVGASFEVGDLKPHGPLTDVAVRWRLREASLTPVCPVSTT